MGSDADDSLERAGYAEALKCMKERCEGTQAATHAEDEQPDDADAMTGDATLVGSTSGDVSLDGPTPGSGSHAGKSPVKALSTLTEQAEESPKKADSNLDPSPKSLSLSPKKILSPVKNDAGPTSASPEKPMTTDGPAESNAVEADGGKQDAMDEDSIFGDTAESEEKVEEVEEVEKPEESKKEEENKVVEEPAAETEEVDLGYLYTASVGLCAGWNTTLLTASGGRYTRTRSVWPRRICSNPDRLGPPSPSPPRLYLRLPPSPRG